MTEKTKTKALAKNQPAKKGAKKKKGKFKYKVRKRKVKKYTSKKIFLKIWCGFSKNHDCILFLEPTKKGAEERAKNFKLKDVSFVSYLQGRWCDWSSHPGAGIIHSKNGVQGRDLIDAFPLPPRTTGNQPAKTLNKKKEIIGEEQKLHSKDDPKTIAQKKTPNGMDQQGIARHTSDVRYLLHNTTSQGEKPQEHPYWASSQNQHHPLLTYTRPGTRRYDIKRLPRRGEPKGRLDRAGL